MKIFGWVQNKFNGRHGNNKRDSILVKNQRRQEPCKKEFNDWPYGLLAIGTFGDDEIKDSNQKHVEKNISPQELTPEEIRKLHNELDALLDIKSDATNLELDKLLNSHISVSEEERSSSNVFDQDHECSDNNDRHLEPSSSVVLSRGRDIYVDNAINRKSLSFILKKMFVCRKGFTPAPSLRDQVPESRMEKILRAVLHKKVYPQSTNPSLSTKKYLENNNNHKHKSAKEDETNDHHKADNGSKWVKTDSEYIVLEI